MSYISISVQTNAKGDTFSRTSATKQDVEDAKAFLDAIEADEATTEEPTTES